MYGSIAVSIVFVAAQRESLHLCIIWVKNMHGHYWVCWMSTGRKYGIIRRTQTHTKL